MFAIPLSAAMRATVSRTRFHSGSFVPACPGRVPDHEVVSPLVLFPDEGSQTAERRTFLFVYALDPVQHRPAEIFESQLVYRPRVGVEFDRQQVQAPAPRSEAQLR